MKIFEQRIELLLKNKMGLRMKNVNISRSFLGVGWGVGEEVMIKQYIGGLS